MAVTPFRKIDTSQTAARVERVMTTATSWMMAAPVVLLPLWFFPVPAAQDFAKQWLLVTLVSLSLLFWMISQLLRGQIRFPWSVPQTLLVALLLVAGVSTALASYQFGSFVGTTSIGTSLLSLVALVVFFFLLTTRSAKEHQRTLVLIFIAAAIAALFAFLQMVGWHILPWEFARRSNFTSVGSINDAAMFLAVTLPLLFSFFLKTDQRSYKIAAAVAVLLSLVVIHLTGSSNVWLVVAAGAFLWLLLAILQRRSLEPRVLMFTVIVFVIALISYFVPRPFYRLNIPLEVGLSYPASINIAKQVVLDSPENFFFGDGPSTFGDSFSLYRPAVLNNIAYAQGAQIYPLWSARFTAAASVWLTLVASIGVLGVGLLFAFVVYTLLQIWRTLDTSDYVQTGFVVAFLSLLAASIVNPFNLTLFFVLILCAAMILPSPREHTVSLVTTSRALAGALVVLIISFISSFVGTFFVGKRAVAEFKAQQAGIVLSANKPNEAVSLLVGAAARVPQEDRYWRLLAAAAQANLAQLGRDKNATADQIRAAIIQSIQSAQQARAVNPRSATNITALGTIYGQVSPYFANAANLAAATFAEAEQYEPTNPVLPTERARSYLIAADYPTLNFQKEGSQEPTQAELAQFQNDSIAKANEAIDHALSLKPDYAPAKFLRALMIARSGNSEEALKELNALQVDNPGDASLHYWRGLFAYRANKLDEARSALESAVATAPNFANAHYILGLIADRQNRKNDAIESFEKVATIDPNAQEVIRILENLRAGRGALEGLTGVTPPTVTTPQP